MTKFVRGVSLAGALALATGCGPNPLVDSWTTTSILGEAPAEGSSATTTYSFGEDSTLNLLVLQTYSLGTPNPAAGCTMTLEIRGLRWASPDGSNGPDSLAITGMASAFDEVVGCTSASMNHARRPNARYSTAFDLHGTYTIMGRLLTLSLAMGSNPPVQIDLNRL